MVNNSSNINKTNNLLSPQVSFTVQVNCFYFAQNLKCSYFLAGVMTMLLCLNTVGSIQRFIMLWGRSKDSPCCGVDPKTHHAVGSIQRLIMLWGRFKDLSCCGVNPKTHQTTLLKLYFLFLG